MNTIVTIPSEVQSHDPVVPASHPNVIKPHEGAVGSGGVSMQEFPIPAKLRKHNHYFKKLPEGVTHIDVYRTLELWGVTDQCIGHAIKKLLVPGRRGGKDVARDIQDAIDSLLRWQEMRLEEGDI